MLNFCLPPKIEKSMLARPKLHGWDDQFNVMHLKIFHQSKTKK